MSLASDPAEAIGKAGLEMTADGEAMMFYAGEVPWHSLGTGVAKAQTSEQAIRLAKLNKWGIHLETMTAASGGESEDRRALVRKSDGKFLSVVKPNYQPIQNERAFQFLDSLVADRVMHYETAGSLNGGRQVWMLARMEEDMRVLDDLYYSYLLAITGHDGNVSFSVYPTEIRVVCRNTYKQATKGKRAVKVRHSGNVEAKLVEAKAVLNVTLESQKRFKEWMTKLGKKKLTNNDVVVVRENIFGPLDDQTPAQRRRAIESFMQIYTAERERQGQTAYSLLQAVTGYGDHYINLRKRPDGEQRMLAELNGSSQEFKARGTAVLEAVTAIKAPPGLFGTAA